MHNKYRYTLGRLEITVFTTGMIIMILEMVGSRVLAPFFGNSIFVWTSIIGIILASLSLGYYCGGRIADKNPTFEAFGVVILMAGVSVGMLAIIKESILQGTMLLGIQWGSVVGSILIFALPSYRLGMVSPFAAKLKIDELTTSGSTVGYLYALSTLGSIVGTFLTGFFLIAWLGHTLILYLLAMILVLVSILAGRFAKKLVITILIVAIVLFFVFIIHQQSPVFSKNLLEKDTAYNHIRVVDQIYEKDGKEIRTLLMGQEIHSAIYVNSDDQPIEYIKYYRLDQVFKKEIKKALTIGGGAYSQPRDYLKRFPEAKIDVVELDPGVTKVARELFRLKDDPRLNIVHQDGRIFLNQNKNQHDVIYIDAFSDFYSIPFQLTTVETIEKIHASLVDNGVVLVNVIGSLQGEKSKLPKAEYKTYSEVFPNVYLFPVNFSASDGPEELQNIMLVASKDSKRFSKDDLINMTKNNLELSEYVNNFYNPDYDMDSIKIMTDEFAPVDNYVLDYL